MTFSQTSSAVAGTWAVRMSRTILSIRFLALQIVHFARAVSSSSPLLPLRVLLAFFSLWWRFLSVQGSSSLVHDHSTSFAKLVGGSQSLSASFVHSEAKSYWQQYSWGFFLLKKRNGFESMHRVEELANRLFRRLPVEILDVDRRVGMFIGPDSSE